MKRIFTTAFVLASWFSISLAQPSGYLGKRMLFEIEMGGLPDFGRSLGVDEDNPWVNWQAGGSLQWVTSNSKAIALHYRYQQTQHDLRMDQARSLAQRAGLTSIEQTDYTFTLVSAPSSLGFTTMHHIGFGWLNYSPGYVAPAGHYTEFELGVIVYDTKFYIPEIGLLDINNPATGVAPYFGLNQMKQHIVLDRFVLKFGYSILFNPLGIGAALAVYQDTNEAIYSDDRLLHTMGLERTFESTTFMFRAGLGLLAF